MDSKELGRIAAQNAKQVIIQKIRDAESDIIYNEYKDRKGTLLAGIVRRFEKGNILIDLGRTEAVLPVSEQIPREHYRAGDRIQTYVVDVVKNTRGCEIIVSRAHPGLMVKLFENEVPEIYEGIVRIESAAREPGARSKIAVASKDSDVDPVGACVGMKGARVQAVVQELRGEKIDIVQWHPDIARYVCNAIQPAEVSRVVLDEKNKSMELIVADDQLSLAIGKKGQNVRLAAKLTGWKIDIHSETKVKKLAEEGREKFKQIEGIGENLADLLYTQGVTSPELLIEHDTDQIAQITGLEAAKIETLKESAKKWLATAPKAPAPEAAPETSTGTGMVRVVPAVGSDEEKQMLQIKGIGAKTIESLRKGGYRSIEVLGSATVDELTNKSGLDKAVANKLIDRAKRYLSGDRSSDVVKSEDQE
jgi:N utilization substance protein A